MTALFSEVCSPIFKQEIQLIRRAIAVMCTSLHKRYNILLVND